MSLLSCFAYINMIMKGDKRSGVFAIIALFFNQMMVLGVFLKPAGMNEISSSGGFLKNKTLRVKLESCLILRTKVAPSLYGNCVNYKMLSFIKDPVFLSVGKKLVLLEETHFTVIYSYCHKYARIWYLE